MNILHMKYAVEVARQGSFSKAAETLYVAQANLSRSIKALEDDLGITIFNRSFKGTVLTPEGEEFIGYARNILSQIESVEKRYKEQISVRRRFSISVPRASYIADAFVHFTNHISEEPIELFYMETNSAIAIENILSSDYKLGIIRYDAEHDRYFKKLLEEKNLTYEVVAEFYYVLIMSKNGQLAQKASLRFSDLYDAVEIVHGDPYVPKLPVKCAARSEQSGELPRTIHLFERGGQFDLLSENAETFMWVSPVPERMLERHGLVQRECRDRTRLYKDLLIYRKEYELSSLDKAFIDELTESRRRTLK